ncbi:hypothetical protein [Pedobacter frigidisoli]|uniref:Crp/Fnr family transcriptional regulator n=1 Tax=Pedobacter frigidisoli TaxID=2530455 RepID=UPI00292DB08B|nr:hypothetical protein [Pedobacter frigidisoli]
MDQLIQLKTCLDAIGLNSLVAWQALAAACVTVKLKTGENFICQAGTVAFIIEGIIKEYDSSLRTKPAIVNLLTANEYVVTFVGSNHHFYRASCPSTLVYIDNTRQWQLFDQFNELQSLYFNIEDLHFQSRQRRTQLLEFNTARERIKAFIRKNRSILPFLRKKDIANYLCLEYNLFVRHYSKLL